MTTTASAEPYSTGDGWSPETRANLRDKFHQMAAGHAVLQPLLIVPGLTDPTTAYALVSSVDRSEFVPPGWKTSLSYHWFGDDLALYGTVSVTPAHEALLTRIADDLRQWCIVHTGDRMDVLLNAKAQFGDSRVWEPDLTVYPKKKKKVAGDSRARLVVEAGYNVGDIAVLRNRAFQYFQNDANQWTGAVMLLSITPDLQHAQCVLYTLSEGAVEVKTALDFGPMPATQHQIQLWDLDQPAWVPSVQLFARCPYSKDALAAVCVPSDVFTRGIMNFGTFSEGVYVDLTAALAAAQACGP